MSSTVTRRYARAFYEEAEQQDVLEAVDDDVALIQATLEASRDLVLFFLNPVIPRQKKENVVRALFAERVQPLTLRFMELLIQKQREDFFPSMIEAYQHFRDEQRGIVEARVRTARALSKKEEKTLAQALEGMTGKRIRLHTTEAPELIGGLMVRIKDTVYDGSVRHQLENLREQLEERSYAMN